MKALAFYLILPFLYLTSCLPFGILYRLSDLTCFFVRGIGYRKKIIMENLTYSFPDKSHDELRQIRKKFYRHFCDLFFETIKLQTISEKNIKKHIIFENLQILDDAFDKNRDVIAVLAHYNNWEWVPAINLFVKAQGCEVYRALKNKQVNQYLLKLRSRFKTLNFTMRATMREVVKMKRNNTRYILGLISDQSPSKKKINYRTIFLNQNTAVIDGAEKMARLTNDMVVFFEMTKTRRGHYKVNVIKLFDEPRATTENEITETHVRHLEKIIFRQPEFWLWSHKRWKYTKNRMATDAESLSRTDS